MISPQASAANEMLRRHRDAAREGDVVPTVAEQRAATAAFAETTGVPDGVAFRDGEAGGVPVLYSCRASRAAQAATSPPVMRAASW